jgi:hypothetical protein
MENIEPDEKIRLLKEHIEKTRTQLYYMLVHLAKLSPAEWEFSHVSPPGQRRVEVHCLIEKSD